MTEHWHDWIDYWSVDFDYESKPEVIKFKTQDGKIEEEWTGNYVFEMSGSHSEAQGGGGQRAA